MDDLISREKTINAIENLNWYHIGENGKLVCGANSTYDKPLFKASDIYNVLNGIPEANKWIPVSERLPEKQGWYLVTDAAGGMRMTEYSFFVPQEGEMEEPYWDYMNVIAWMPLPHPYKAESEDTE